MEKKIFISIIIILLLFFVSCEKIFIPKDTENTPTNNFKYLWTRVSMEYAFFDVKKVDWDSIYIVYEKYVSDDIDDDSLFNVLAAMMNELKDGHVNLYSPFNVSHYPIGMMGPCNINTRLVKEKYLGLDYITTGSFYHNFICDKEVGYVYYPSFSSSSISDYELDYILNRYKNTKGLILDLRQNGGGYVDNVLKLLSPFSSGTPYLYKTQLRNASDYDSFSDFQQVYAPYSEEQKYKSPLYVLVDRGTYSAASFFSVCTKAYDNIVLVGDTTGGGLGLPNGGQLPNSWTYRVSVTRTIASDGMNYEQGVVPDFTVILSQDSVNAGVDNVIEYAVRKILNCGL